MTLTEAQPKRERSLTEGRCCAFCCAPHDWVGPFLIAEAPPASKSGSSLFKFYTAMGSTDIERQPSRNEKVQNTHKF